MPRNMPSLPELISCQVRVTLLLYLHLLLLVVIETNASGTMCEENKFLNSGNMCVRLCEPGQFGDVATGKCVECSSSCKTCQDNRNHCTSCSEPNYLLQSSCVTDCGDLKKRIPLPKRARIVSGPSEFEGRLEVYHEEKWGTVCDDGWTLSNAEVVCRELQLGNAVNGGVFNATSAPPLIHLDNVKCSGSESNLEMCSHDSWGNHDCGHSEDVGIKCSGTSGPDESRMCVDICGDGYYVDDNGQCQQCHSSCKTCSAGGRLACNACDEPSFLKGTSCIPICDVGFYGHTETRMCTKCSENCRNCRDGTSDIVCISCPSGTQLDGTECVSSCGERKTKHLPIRLVDGKNLYEGRVEVFINNEWGTVCDDNWDINDVEVVCRQLGFGYGLTAVGSSNFGPGRGKIFVDRIYCTGEEGELINCIQAPFAENQCFHQEDAGAVCAGTSSVATNFGSHLSSISDSGASGRCVDDCGTGYFVQGINNDCQTCSSQCLSCDRNADRCTSCKPGTFLEGSSCVIECGEGKFGNLDSGICLDCNAHLCRTCLNGRRDSICTSCSDGYFLSGDTCLMLCPAGSFRSKGLCVSGCPFRQYAREGACRPCPESCRTCDAIQAGGGDPPMCTSCAPRKILQDGQCVDRCSSGLYAWPMDINGALIAPETAVRLADGRNHLEGRLEVYYNDAWGTVCHDHWRQAASRVVCSELGLGDEDSLLEVGEDSGIPMGNENVTIWLDNVSCELSASAISSCSHSGWGIHNCEHGQDVALRCSGPGYRKCVTSCPEGYYRNGTNCRLCHENCARCGILSTARYTCSACEAGFHLLGQECVSECGPGHHVSPGSGSCLLCDETCVTCEGESSTCTSCPENSYLQGSECVQECSELKLKLNDNVRIVAGPGPLQGRVEVKIGGQWGTICDDNWSLEEAEVVCKELGLGKPLEVFYEAKFGPGPGEIYFDDMECTGNETSIFDCHHAGAGNHDCHHSEDAGVHCSGPLEYNICYPRAECVGSVGYYILDDQYCSKCSASCLSCQSGADLCLSCKPGFFLEQNTCVAFCASGSFGDAEGICRSCSASCNSCEERPEKCTKCFSGQYLEVATSTCVDNCNNGYITRAKSDVRLAGADLDPLRGRVEILHDGQWGTVCDDSWDLNDAQVVCRMLGLGDAGEAHPQGVFGQGKGEIWLDEMQCSGTEQNLAACRTDSAGFGHHDCYHHEDAGVTCLGPDGSQQCVTACGDGYYSDDDRHCRECSPECGSCLEMSDKCTSCPAGKFLVNETCVTDCGAGSYGNTIKGLCQKCNPACLECFDGYRNTRCKRCFAGSNLQSDTCVQECRSGLASVVDFISEEGLGMDRVRLVGGSRPSEGIVQVYHDGQWGGICGTNWDRSDADVVCKELGYGVPTSVVSASQFTAPSDYPTHMDRVQCTGSEYYLSQCNHAGYGHRDCDPNHMGDAAIRCAEGSPRVNHYENPQLCRRLNDGVCTRTTCYPGVPCLNVGQEGSLCMECPNGTFGDGANCTVVASSLPEFRDNSQGQNKTVQAGSPITFLCAGNGSPPPRVTASSWKKDGHEISPEEYASGRISIFSYGSIYISQARASDVGNYTCTLRNSHGINSIANVLIVEEPPTVLGVTPVIGILEQEEKLQCNYRGVPSPTVEWEKNGVLIDASNSRYSVSNPPQNLTIHNLQADDDAIYTCVCYNKLGRYHAEIPLTILVPPTFTKEPRDMAVSEDETVTLPCAAFGKPTPSITWKKNGERLSMDNPRYFLNGTSLTILGVKRQDMGRFNCIAQNSVQVKECSGKLLVKGLPQITTPPQNQTKVSGETMVLECAAIGYPAPSVTWLHDGERMEEDGEHVITDGSLTIANVKILDMGLYTCVAKNMIGAVRESAYLNVNGPVRYGTQKHIGTAVSYIVTIVIILMLVLIVLVVYLRKRKSSPLLKKYRTLGVEKSSTSISFTPQSIYKCKSPGSPSHVTIKTSGDDCLTKSILPEEEIANEEEGQV